jgi:hypothetical protein
MANPALLLAAAAAAVYFITQKGDDEPSEEGAGGESGEVDPPPGDGSVVLKPVGTVGCNEDLPYRVMIQDWPDHGHDVLDSEPSSIEPGAGGAVFHIGDLEATPGELKNMIEFEWNVGEGGYKDHRHTITLTGAQIGTLVRTGKLEGVKTDNGWYFEGAPGQTQTKKLLTHNHNVTLTCQRGEGSVPGGPK